MIKYLLKRILIFIPTFIIISLLAFVISSNAPGDPIERLTNSADSEGAASTGNTSNKKDKEQLRKKLGLDKPIFYFSLTSVAQSDTLYKISDLGQRDNLAHLTDIHCDWKEISDYYKSLINLQNAHVKFNNSFQDSVYKALSFYKDTTTISVDSLFKNYPIYKNRTIVEYDTLIKDYEYVSGSSVEKKDTLLHISALKDSSIILIDTLIKGYKYKSDSTLLFLYTKNEINEAINNSSLTANELLETANDNKIKVKLDELDSLYNDFTFLNSLIERYTTVKSAYNKVIENENRWKKYIPSIIWYGSNNQYHNWLLGEAPWFDSTADSTLRKGLLRGDFGFSYMDQKPISTKINQYFWRSFWLILFSIILSYIVSIPIGIYAANHKDSLFDRSSSVFLFILYSLPTFFIGTLLLWLFSNPDNVVWFPSGGFEDPVAIEHASDWWEHFVNRLPYKILPLITYTYGSFAFLSRIMRTGMLEVLNQDYIRTARAKGLSQKSIVLKHALRNSLLPIITVFANVFPVAVGGSVIIETIFSYPGMGLASYEAIQNQDYPMIVAIFTLAGFMTMVGYLIADLLYTLVDPRISFTKN